MRINNNITLTNIRENFSKAKYLYEHLILSIIRFNADIDGET